MRLYIVLKSQLVKVPSHALARLIRAPDELEEQLRAELSIGVHRGQLPSGYKESGAESAIEDGRLAEVRLLRCIGFGFHVGGVAEAVRRALSCKKRATTC